MPTLFGRNYCRGLEHVSKTERVIGLAVLLLLCGIMAAYVLQVRSDRDYLFNVAETAADQPQESRELAIARQMVPGLQEGAWPPTISGWKNAGEVEAIPAANLPVELAAAAADFQEFGVEWVYRRSYETTAPPMRWLTVLVCDVTSPAGASVLCRTRHLADATPFNVGRGGWLAGDSMSAGFWNGRFYTELRASAGLSDTAITLPAAAAAIASTQLSYGERVEMSPAAPSDHELPGIDDDYASSDPRRSGSTQTSPFPDPGVTGWRRPRAASRFTPDNLYEKINGRAATYLQFHVVELAFGTYFHRSDASRTIDVYWYDMGESQNAYGMYRAEAPQDATSVPLGREGYQVFGAVFFCKGSSYVQVLPVGEDEADAQAALEIATRIEEGIEDSDEGFWADAILPAAGRQSDSIDYLAANAFGLDFLEDVFTADYDHGGGRVKLFIHRADDSNEAYALFEQYQAFFERYGRLAWTDTSGSRRMVAGEVARITDVVFVKGRYLGGVSGADELKAAREAAIAFHDELSESN